MIRQPSNPTSPSAPLPEGDWFKMVGYSHGEYEFGWDDYVGDESDFDCEADEPPPPYETISCTLGFQWATSPQEARTKFAIHQGFRSEEEFLLSMAVSPDDNNSLQAEDTSQMEEYEWELFLEEEKRQ